MTICLFFGLFSCESLEDTVDVGDGTIRYVGKCSDLVVTPDWESMQLTWKNSIDPGIVNIKVKWSGGGIEKDTLLPKDAEKCLIPNLENYAYTFQVYAVDANGRLSVESIDYGIPYTMEHEFFSMFSSIVLKAFKLKDDGKHVVLFFDSWSTNLKSAKIVYTSDLNEKITIDLTEADLEAKYYQLSGVSSDTLEILREARIGDLDKTVWIDPLKMDITNRFFNNDFLSLVKHQLNKGDDDNLTEEDIEGVTRLEFDYTISSFEDILHFPNLRELHLGKNRYLRADKINIEDRWYNVLPVVSDATNSNYALQMSRELKGVEVIRYNEYLYPTLKTDYITEKPLASVPTDLQYVDTTGWTWTYTPEDESGFDPRVVNLLDDNDNSVWDPNVDFTMREHIITFDMGQPKAVRGFKITQRIPANAVERNYRPGSVRIQISADKTTWENVSWETDITVGRGSGEKTLIYLKNGETKNVQYIRLTIFDVASAERYSVGLAGFDVIAGE